MWTLMVKSHNGNIIGTGNSVLEVCVKYKASLSNANLRSASLRNANLYGANLRGATLSHAYLYGANLRNASLQNSDLSSANLRGADLRGANLWGADLRGATMPDGRKWEDYEADHLAGICDTRKVRDKAIAAWGKHFWTNCPMHKALGVSSIEEVEENKRLVVAAWVALYDGRKLAKPAK